MLISRFIYIIVSLILIAVLLALTFVFPNYYFLTATIMLLILLFLRKQRQKDLQMRMNILMDYHSTCDYQKYIEEIRKINKKSILGQSKRFIEEVNIGLALVAAGELSKAEELIIELSTKQSIVNHVALLFYLRLCNDYFFFLNKPEEMEITINKMNHILDNSNTTIRFQFSIIIVLCDIKKEILLGRNLERSQEVYEKLKMPPTTINLISKEYLLALIDIKFKDFENARKRLINVSKQNYNLLYVEKAKVLLEEMNNKNAE